MTDSTAPAAPPAEAQPNLATQIRRCKGCGSHFEADFEETHCAACVKWRELVNFNEAMAEMVRVRRP